MTEPNPARAVALSIARARLRQDVESWEPARAVTGADPAEVQAELGKIADALTGGRVLPADAETRWGVVLEDGTTLETLTEYGARRHAQELNLPLVHRHVGPWLPAPTEES